MNILTIGLENYIKNSIDSINTKYTFKHIQYSEFINLSFVNRFEEYIKYDTIIIGIDKSKLDFKGIIDFDVYYKVLNNIIYLIEKGYEIKKIIFLSSYGVYRGKESGLYTENDPISPEDYISSLYYHYENILSIACKETSKTLVIIRQFNIYSLYQNENYIIISLINQIFNSSDIFIGDGRKKRDYVYIKDFITFLSLVLEKEFENKCNIYNFGSGNSYTVKEVIATLEKITGHRKNILFNPEKLRLYVDYDDVRADITKIQNEFNFNIKYDLFSGLEDLIQLWKIYKERN